jgi:lipopolysaccharide heptosyltransferase I
VRIDARNIAIVRLGSIGDVVNTLPLLNRLRAGYPSSHLTWIVEEKSAPILEGHPALDGLILFPRRYPWLWPAFVRRLRMMKFDLIIECQRITRSGLIAVLSGAPNRLGFDRVRCKEGSWIFTNFRIPPCDHSGVMLEQYLEFAEYLELPPAPVSWGITLNQSHRDKIVAFLGPDNVATIILNVGATKRENLWPEGHFVTLVNRLVPHWKGRIVLTGGALDRGRAARVMRGLPVHDTSGMFSLKELAALFETSAIVVSCDTGPLHLAVAMGVPVVGLYGPSDPQRTGPYGRSDWILVGSGGSQCRSCRRWCGDPYTPCMRSISPDMVFDKIEKRLAGHPSWVP